MSAFEIGVTHDLSYLDQGPPLAAPIDLYFNAVVKFDREAWYWPELEAMSITSDDVESARAQIYCEGATRQRYEGGTRMNGSTYEWWQKEDDGYVGGYKTDSTIIGSTSLAFIRQTATDTLLPQMIADVEDKITINADGVTIMEATKLAKAYLDWRGQSGYGFQFMIIPELPTGVTFDLDHLGSANWGREIIKACSDVNAHRETIDGMPTEIWSVKHTFLHFDVLDIAKLNVRLKSGLTIETTRRAPYGLVPA